MNNTHKINGHPTDTTLDYLQMKSLLCKDPEIDKKEITDYIYTRILKQWIHYIDLQSKKYAALDDLQLKTIKKPKALSFLDSLILNICEIAKDPYDLNIMVESSIKYKPNKKEIEEEITYIYLRYDKQSLMEQTVRSNYYGVRTMIVRNLMVIESTTDANLFPSDQRSIYEYADVVKHDKDSITIKI